MKQALRLIAAIAGAGLISCVAAASWLLYTVRVDRTHPATSTQVIVPRGSSFSQISRQLAAAGVIGNAFAFDVLARVERDDVSVHAGAYRFAPHETSSEILHALLTGGAQIATWVTFPEGFTAAQIARRLQEAGVGNAGTLLASFRSTSIVVDGSRTRNLEGFLFPSTYLVPLDATPAQIEKQLTTQFRKELPADAARRARALHITVPQVVTVASLIEREAKIDADRPLIASVIYNRLRLGMPLQIDATIEYALPHHKTELSFADLKIDSPYNTYLHSGLPPTPIANPGRASLEAAFHPATTEDLYYVYCGNGHHVFAKTLAQHQANVARCLH